MKVIRVYRKSRRPARVGWFAVVGLLLSFATRAHAEAPGLLVLHAQAAPGSVEDDLHEAVRKALRDVQDARLLPEPALDLEAVQLAIGCTDESEECLRAIAKRMDADILLLTSVVRGKHSLELRITRFTRAGDEAPAVAMRKQEGTLLRASRLEAVPGMLQELLPFERALREPEPEGESDAAEPARATVAPPPTDAREDSGGSSIGPWLLGGGGVALLTAGVVAGALSSATESEYASINVDSQARAEEAESLRSQGTNQARVANVLLVAGVGTLIGAGIWYAIDASSQESAPPSARLTPAIDEHGAGLVLSGVWESP